MSKPILHAESTARKFGGEPEEYVHIHDLMDEPKASHPTVKFRAIFHSSYGIWLVEKILGHSFKNSVGRTVPVRDVAEQHVLEDLGHIPSLEQWLAEMKIAPWMSGRKKIAVELVD